MRTLVQSNISCINKYLFATFTKFQEHKCTKNRMWALKNLVKVNKKKNSVFVREYKTDKYFLRKEFSIVNGRFGLNSFNIQLN